ncbi:transcriptional regulator [Flavobacterium sp. ARAG 55.4]|uniref:transcriptional regulator n=1 Tax=Flavobacterium sp. ARAG 55.4 TaxID=3451357 RepID=UPI003F46EF1E
MFLYFALFPVCSYSQYDFKTNPYLEKAEQLKYINPDSSISYYKKSIAIYEKEKDTVNIINNIMALSFLYAHIVDYGRSYDGYWKALLLADKSKDDVSKARIYQALGWLYSYYDRNEEALQYFNHSLEITKRNIDKHEIRNYEYLSQDYFSILNLYRVNHNYTKAKIYLDSCYIAHKQINSGKKSYYIEAEAAYLDAVDKKYDLSLTKLKEVNDYFEISDPSYLVIIDYLIGDVYRMKGDLANSIIYFEKSLTFSKKYKSHSNYRLMTHEVLAKIYAATGNYKNAYLHSNQAMIFNAQVFGKNSKNSQHLFEINDKYHIQKEKEKEIIRLQRIKELEHEESIANLKTILYSLIVISLLLYGRLLIKNIRRKHQAEKQALAEKQEMELQKSKEILELKNKELTSSALQLIEKDEFIERLKVNLTENKENVDVRTINKMLKTIQGTPSSNWKEFEARFTAVNQSFYSNLKEKYPDLGQTDLKICALIKLNFSSKDMASLLGISFESVHTSRYRLRKKFKLDRNDNLNDFIAGI